jgi:hypothetical protein
MTRLILVPQLPIAMRYQEWFAEEIEDHLSSYFDSIIVLGDKRLNNPFYLTSGNSFSSIEHALKFEQEQMRQYLDMKLEEDDVLLLCDLSYPGIFSSVLMIKPAPRQYAICHATAANRYDFWAKIRGIKYGVEKRQARLFDKIFVGSEYHKNKLKWPNIEVIGMPYPPIPRLIEIEHEVNKEKFKHRNTVLRSVARPTQQKVTLKLERRVEELLGIPIVREQFSTWYDYFSALCDTQFVIITAREETYGYQALDAMLCGAVPIAPNALSYPELVPSAALYDPTSIETAAFSIWDIVEELSERPLTFTFLEDTFFLKLAKGMELV